MALAEGMDRDAIIAHLTLHDWEPALARWGAGLVNRNLFMWCDEDGDVRTDYAAAISTVRSQWQCAMDSQLVAYYQYLEVHGL